MWSLQKQISSFKNQKIQFLSEFAICHLTLRKIVVPRKYMLVVDFNVRKNFIFKIQTKASHLLVSCGHCNRIHQNSFIVVGDKFICLSQVPSWSFFSSSLEETLSLSEKKDTKNSKQGYIVRISTLVPGNNGLNLSALQETKCHEEEYIASQQVPMQVRQVQLLAWKHP